MKGFISYAHDDHRAFLDLRKHVKPIERMFALDFWADKRLKPGDYWNDGIRKAIDDACVHILLMSPAFLASDYIFDNELPAIGRKYLAGDLVVPVIVERCLWQPFVKSLQAAPTSHAGKLVPVSEWRPVRNGFSAAGEQLMAAIEGHVGPGSDPNLFGVRP